MIWSINHQPDLKLYISENELIDLETEWFLSWKVWNHVNASISEVLLCFDKWINEWTFTLQWNILFPIIGRNINNELKINWWFWWERFQWSSRKISIINFTRLQAMTLLNIDSDTIMWFEWGLESLIQKLS